MNMEEGGEAGHAGVSTGLYSGVWDGRCGNQNLPPLNRITGGYPTGEHEVKLSTDFPNNSIDLIIPTVRSSRGSLRCCAAATTPTAIFVGPALCRRSGC